MALYKRPNSKYWWMKFHFEGELLQRSTKCTNKADARIFESGLRTALAMGKIGIKAKSEAPTFKQATEDFLKWSKVNHAQKPASYLRVEYSCRAPRNFLGAKKTDRIKPKDIENFLVWRLNQISRKTGEQITRDTVNLELIALKAVFRRLVAADVLPKSPAQNVKQLAENKRSFYVLTSDEERLYLMACPQPLRDVARLMFETGMRPNEVYTLTRRNISIEKGFLQIENGKTKSSNRRVWLSDKASKVLKSRLAKFKGEYLFPKGDKDGGEPTYQLNDQHRTARKSTGLKFRLYDLRHTFATRALENTDLLTLASMLGHSSLDEVIRYAHPSENRKNEAMRDMQKKQAKAV